ncbi:MAG: hypothetical protein H7829_11680 [Magnetococcus sp. THC-1_WYH]
MIEAVGFGKGTGHLWLRSLHLIGGDVQATEVRFVTFGQDIPVVPHRFRQVVGIDNVGLYKVAQAMDGSVRMVFGREENKVYDYESGK